MQKTIETPTTNSKVGRTYALGPINGKEAKPPEHPIRDRSDRETVPIPVE